MNQGTLIRPVASDLRSSAARAIFDILRQTDNIFLAICALCRGKVVSLHPDNVNARKLWQQQPQEDDRRRTR